MMKIKADIKEKWANQKENSIKVSVLQTSYQQIVVVKCE